MNKDKEVTDGKTVLNIISLASGILNVIFSGFAIYILVLRVIFLLHNKEFITVYDYLYIGLAALYLLINLIGTIMVIVRYFIPVMQTNSIMIIIFKVIFFFGITFLGVTVLGLIGVVVSLPKSDYVDYIKFLLFEVIIGEAVGLLVFLGTFIPIILFPKPTIEESPYQMYQMVKIRSEN